MKCKKCGANYPDDNAFCWNCKTPKGEGGIEKCKNDPNAIEWGAVIGGMLLLLLIFGILIWTWVAFNNPLPFFVFGIPLIVAGLWQTRFMQVIVKIVMFLIIIAFFLIVWIVGRSMWPPSTW